MRLGGSEVFTLAGLHGYLPLGFSRRPSLVILMLASALATLIFLYACLIGNSWDRPHPTASLLSPRYSLDEMRAFALKNAVFPKRKQIGSPIRSVSFNSIVQYPNRNLFSIDREGALHTLIFLHIQKTAGTSFEKFLTRSLNITHPCDCSLGRKRCSCYRPGTNNSVWLFSRYSTGWACGLHSDYTETIISGCAERVLDRKDGQHKKRRYYLTTFVRDPIERFVSEFAHVARGATWSASRHLCNGRFPSPMELPMCFDPEDGWKGVSLSEFLACPFNLAFNRQTRMLADLTLVDCYYKSTSAPSDREDRIMLESAKSNLKQMAFFGIKERMNDSQHLFEKLFGLRFMGSLAEWNKSKSSVADVSMWQMALIRERNRLDIELYAFAEALFNNRLALVEEKLGDK